MIPDARIASIPLAGTAPPTAALGDAGAFPCIGVMRGRVWRAGDRPIHNGLDVAARRTP